MTYTVQFTNKNKTPIIIDDAQIDTSTDVTLFGRTRLAYGEALQENLLHILENFSCPEDPYNPGNPDLNVSEDGIFHNPIEGQCWYNSTQEVLTFYDGTNWIPLARQDGVAANWGMIYDGGFLPNPVSAVSGKVFDYNECVYIVSPQSIPTKIDYYVCTVDGTGKVNMKYRNVGGQSLTSGIANFLIVGIAGNVNQTAPPIQPSPTPSVTPTTSVGVSLTPSPTVTPTHTPPASATPSPTPVVSPTRTPAASVTPTPVPSNTPQPSISPTPSPVPSTLGFEGQHYQRACGIPQNMASGNAGLTIFFGSSGWQIQYNCHGNVTTIASGTIPSVAYTVSASATYRPDLDTTGFSLSAGTVGNNTNLPIGNNTAFIGVSCAPVRGNSGNDSATCYAINVTMNDINGHQIINSTCYFDVGAMGTA